MRSCALGGSRSCARPSACATSSCSTTRRSSGETVRRRASRSRGRCRDDAIEERNDLAAQDRGHGASSTARSVRATDHSRSTVAGEISQRGRGFGDRESGEEAHLDDRRLARVGTLQFLQRMIEREDVGPARFKDRLHAVERDRGDAPAALLRAAPFRIVDQDLAHQARGDPEVVTTTLKPVGAVALQPKPCLVNQRRGASTCAADARRGRAGGRRSAGVHRTPAPPHRRNAARVREAR